LAERPSAQPAAPFAFDGADFTIRAALWFAAVGLFFPALVTILTFHSNEQLGPTITGAVSGTAPLFALLGAGLLLGKKVPGQAAFACMAIVAGVAVLSWKRGAVLLMYGALSIAPVSFAAPIVASYPLITALVSAVVLREEPVTLRMAAGATITVLAVVYLVASKTGA